MKYNFIPGTGLLVSELCFGTMTFGGNGVWEAIGTLQQEEVNVMMKSVFDSGINFIDTANVYSLGQSEQLLGNAIKQVGFNRHELIIATKVKGRMGEGINQVGLSRFHVMRSVEESLTRLQMDHIDILYVHGVDYYTSVENIMQTLNDLVVSGKVRYIAVCNWPAWMVMKAIGISKREGWSQFIGLQYFYSLACRDIEREIVPLVLDQRLALFPWSPLAGGFLSGKYSRNQEKAGNSRRDVFDFPPLNKGKAYDIIDLMQTIGKSHGVSVAQVALTWVRNQAWVTSTIIGAKSTEQLKDNVDSTLLVLTAEESNLLNQVSQPLAEYPGWMLERQHADRLPTKK
ncbi:MAG: aldo/keto reductase [Chitinophagaceae bacterium]